MKAHGGLEVQLHSFLTSALDDMSVHLWVSAPNIHSAEGWMGHLADLDALENRKTCCPCWESNHNSLVIHYTDYSSPASIINKAKHNINMNFPHIHTHTLDEWKWNPNSSRNWTVCNNKWTQFLFTTILYVLRIV